MSNAFSIKVKPAVEGPDFSASIRSLAARQSAPLTTWTSSIAVSPT